MSTAEPVAPDFKLRHLGNTAYAMSVITGAGGQVLFLGDEFGGAWWAYGAALGLAAFAEAVMVSGGDKSLYHRAHDHSWVPMLAVAVAVALYAGAMNVAHFWHENVALAFTFGGASVIGFAQHIIDGHIKVSAYLKAAKAFRAAQVVAPKSSRSARPPAAARETTPAATTSPAAGEPAAPVTHPSTPQAGAATPATNVREIHPGRPTLKEQGKAWFLAQVAAGRESSSISAAEVDKEIGATVGYCKKHIQRWRDEVAAQTAVNQ